MLEDFRSAMMSTGSSGPSTVKDPYVPPVQLGQKPPVGKRLDLACKE